MSQYTEKMAAKRRGKFLEKKLAEAKAEMRSDPAYQEAMNQVKANSVPIYYIREMVKATRLPEVKEALERRARKKSPIS